MGITSAEEELRSRIMTACSDERCGGGDGSGEAGLVTSAERSAALRKKIENIHRRTFLFRHLLAAAFPAGRRGTDPSLSDA